MTTHPTVAERFFFDTNGYLVLEDFLPADRTAALYGAVERVIARREAPGFARERSLSRFHAESSLEV